MLHKSKVLNIIVTLKTSWNPFDRVTVLYGLFVRIIIRDKIFIIISVIQVTQSTLENAAEGEYKDSNEFLWRT